MTPLGQGGESAVVSGPSGSDPVAILSVLDPAPPNSRTLVLNASFEPLSIVGSRRAVVLVLTDKAEIIHAAEGRYRAERVEVPEPSVVRLVRYVRVPYGTKVAVNRRTIFARDGGRCQYCGAAAESLDHVIPRSKGGPHTWENVVAACRRCNSRKEDRLLDEVDMTLRTQPTAPRHRVEILALCGRARQEWSDYLDVYGAPSQRRSA